MNPLIVPRPSPMASRRLVCFAHAGGGASAFLSWPAGLPADIELCAFQYAGREWRYDEQPPSTIAAIVDEAVDALRPYVMLPYAIFGHSMGARVAFEVARRLAAQGRPPLHLFVSALRAPALPDPRPPMRQLTDDEFLAETQRRFGGIPEEVRQRDDLLAMLLPALRADIAALEQHAHVAGVPLACPITAYGAAGDATATPEQLEAWRGETSGAFSREEFPGDHFYLNDERAALLQSMARRLRSS